MRLGVRFRNHITPQPPARSFFDERLSITLTLAVRPAHVYDVGTLCQQRQGRLRLVHPDPPVAVSGRCLQFQRWRARQSGFASLFDLLEIYHRVVLLGREWRPEPFTHMMIEISREDHVEQSSRSAEQALIDALEEELGEYRLSGTEFRVRYAGAADLPSGHLRLSFGYGVHLPAPGADGQPGEELSARVEAAPRSGSYTPLLLPDSVAAARYPGQELLAIGRRERAAVRLPPSCVEAADRLGDRLLEVSLAKASDGPEPVRVVPPDPDFAVTPVPTPEGLVIEIRERSVLLLRLRMARTEEGREEGGLHLSVAGVLLPRATNEPLTGRGNETVEVRGWELHLTLNGAPAPLETVETERLRLRAEAGRGLRAWQPGRARPEAVAPGSRLGSAVRLLPGVDHLRDLALLMPASPFARLRVPSGRPVALGRGGLMPRWLDGCTLLEGEGRFGEIGLAGRSIEVRRAGEGLGLVGDGPALPIRRGLPGARWDLAALLTTHALPIERGDEFLLGPFLIRCEAGPSPA